MIKTPSTLRELNQLLDSISLPSITSGAELDALFERLADNNVTGRDRLTNALTSATNPDNRTRGNTIAFLRTHIKAVQDVAGRAPQRSSEQQPIDERRVSREPQRDAGRQGHGREGAQNPRSLHAPGREASDTPRSQRQDRDDAVDPRTRDGDSSDRMKVRAYARKAAFCAEADTTRGGVPTVRFEFAAAVGEQQYDWKKKLTFQFTEDEIIEAAAVLLGFVPSASFRNHGDDKKWIEIENQGRNVCLKAGSSQANSMRIVPITIGRATALTALLARQVDLGLFQVGRTGMLPLILAKVTARLLNAEEARSGATASGGARRQ